LDKWDNSKIEDDCQPGEKYLRDYSKVRMWDDYIQNVSESSLALNREQELFERSRCPFVRTIITPPPPPPPRKPCEESFILSNNLIQSAKITWIETFGFTHVEFLPEAAKIAATGICAYAFKITDYHETSTLITEIGLSQISQTIDCTEQSIKSAICYDMGSQVNLMLNNVITHLVDSVENGWTQPSTDVCYEKTGVWPSAEKHVFDFDQENQFDTRPDLGFTWGIGWNFEPWKNGTPDNHYSANIYQGDGYHKDMTNVFDFKVKGKGMWVGGWWG